MKFEFNEKKNAITCCITLGEITCMGFAKCSKNDTFDLEKGKSIAYLRAKSQELNTRLKSLQSLKTKLEELAEDYAWKGSRVKNPEISVSVINKYINRMICGGSKKAQNCYLGINDKIAELKEKIHKINIELNELTK